ncbi:CoA-substrate-specific enzyme activase, putative [Desulfosporosinus orientis DSM 765]|uniref:CoA-substrate-specific enzyme activase, putative n=1 Tax=Desulfosporosinus orientis (strain ATCC 19365 / DSM 765 / NCIMB 8382 / VKM B-1628 / Singapore I) TaxID=768706 RepID=G7W9T7_DESOD|nr:acyl-CoA dehydratase activase [Desulfosporosinus orientis]AET70653.1 CoA-substrate-specific enzyme activase, putative [Desulfosporosinus orientis DSM 765]
MSGKLICGIDLGSRNVKIALMKDNREGKALEVLRLESLDTIRFYREYGRKQGGKLVINFEALGLPEVDQLISTGYGRNTLELAGGEAIPELKAHVIGAIYQTGLKDFTLVDLGGQDSKIIQVQKGRMIDFLTNDKCAASSGRYLENMATILDLSLEELGRHMDAPVELNSTCAVFGESELIGKIVEGFPLSELAAGVNTTIVKRILPLLRSFPGQVIVFTGGVAFNQAVGKLLELGTGRQILIPPEPQFNGAIGCCAYAANQE